MHPWTADLVTRNIGTGLRAQHERALAMRVPPVPTAAGRLRRSDRHPPPPRRPAPHDDIPGIAQQAIAILPGTLATVAYLAEIRPLIPAAERAWILVADLEVQALLSAGDLPAATRQLRAIHQQVQARAAADPANTGWQRDLSVSHNKIGDLAVAAGDLAAARTAHQASLASACGWPPPTPPTPDGSGTCTSHASGSTTCLTRHSSSLKHMPERTGVLVLWWIGRCRDIAAVTC